MPRPISTVRQSPSSRARKRLSVVVVGAGAFGGWTALHLLRQGAWVTLVDAWGPGNSRASSGGETRIIRATYGPDRIYVEMVARSLELWRESESRWNRKLYHRTGVLWLAGPDDQYEKAAVRLLGEAGLAFEQLKARQAARRFLQFRFEGVKWAILEKDAGYLTARVACEAVLAGFLEEGGEYRQLAAKPGAIRGKEMQDIVLSDSSRLSADCYVFAGGPWLGQIFPEVIGTRIAPTRQEVFFFGPPAGDARFSEGEMPAWIDHGEQRFYGIPGNRWRGFKIADDNRGGAFDPTSSDRTPTPSSIEAARRYLEFRFPGMRNTPLLESRVCQYENSCDHHFILDRHPGAENVWLAGGGSGHGFKHGPAVGERVARLVLGKAAVDPFFALGRFGKSL